MGNQTNTIDLNGKRYDARTGKIISDIGIGPITISTQKKPMTKNIDGVVKSASSESGSQKVEVNRSVANHTKRKLKKSQTLMRPVVKKPTIQSSASTHVGVTTKLSKPSLTRIANANNTQTSSMVSKFGIKHSGITKKTNVHLPVNHPVTHNSPTPSTTKNVSELEKFEQALRSADSHLQKFEGDIKKKGLKLFKKRRTASAFAMVSAVLLLVGFFGYQNATLVSLKIASSQAGFSAKMPSYTPAGFSAQKTVDKEDGKITISFNARADERSYKITEQPSNWSSVALLNQYVTKNSCASCYETWPQNGKTIYTYDGSNATWVDGGVWYKIEGQSNLTNDQLQRIVSSL